MAQYLDTEKIRKDFPYLENKIRGKEPVYFDSAATSQKPRQVLDTLSRVYSYYNAPVNRSVNSQSSISNLLYGEARKSAASFIGADSPREIIFTKNSTEGINLLCNSLALCPDEYLRPGEGDEIIISHMEHHSNYIPWFIMSEKSGAVVRTVPLTTEGLVDLDSLRRMVNSKTKLVICTHVSNVTGAINPVSDIASIARDAGALSIIDGTQSVPHMPVSVKDLGCDFFLFSGHKMLAPAGTGVLWGREHLLELLPPFMTGGGMIKEIRGKEQKFIWEELPWKFEAGTPDFCGAVALGGAHIPVINPPLTGAMDYLIQIGMNNIRRHEAELTGYTLDRLAAFGDSIQVYGPRKGGARCGIISFNVFKGADMVEPHLVSGFLDGEGIFIRSGGHCAYPFVRHLGIDGTLRISYYVYNTIDEVDYFITILEDIINNRLL